MDSLYIKGERFDEIFMVIIKDAFSNFISEYE